MKAILGCLFIIGAIVVVIRILKNKCGCCEAAICFDACGDIDCDGIDCSDIDCNVD